MSRTIQIRLVRANDYAELREVRLSTLAYSPHLAEHLAKERAAPIEFWRNRAEQRAKATTAATFVAVDDPATFVGVVEIGQDLLVAVCDWARERGARRAGLWVRRANEPARLLYEHAGFVAAPVPNDAKRTGLRLERVP